MIEVMWNTNISEVGKRLVSMRQEGGVAALGRVLTLVISANEPMDEAVVGAANHASNEHPMRVIVLLANPEAEARLDAEIRIGADAGASEVIVLRAYGEVCTGVESLVTGLLLPDAPVVVWWPGAAPDDPRADPLGRIAQRRIVDSAVPSHRGRHRARIEGYSAGDTDLAWTRLTRWREFLAAILDQPPFEPVTSVEVVGEAGSPSTRLIAGWLEMLLGVPTSCTLIDDGGSEVGLRSVTLRRESGDAVLERISGSRAVLRQPGQPQHDIVLPRRTLQQCLVEELRSLGEDVMYGRVLEHLGQSGPEDKTSE